MQYGTFEYIVVTTKNVRDIFKVEDFVAPLVSEPSTIVLIQNGVDIGADVNFWSHCNGTLCALYDILDWKVVIMQLNDLKSW